MHNAVIPLMKGARGMWMLHSFIGISAQKAEPMEHPPYPLRKGDLGFVYPDFSDRVLNNSSSLPLWMTSPISYTEN